MEPYLSYAWQPDQPKNNAIAVGFTILDLASLILCLQLALPPPHAGVDPFAAVAAVEFCEEEDELKLLPPVCQPLQPEVSALQFIRSGP